MTQTVHPTHMANTIVVGSRVLPHIKRELSRQGIHVIETITTRGLLLRHADVFDEMKHEYRATFRDCERNPGNICAIVARGDVNDMQALARELCDRIAEPVPAQYDADIENILHKEGAL